MSSQQEARTNLQELKASPGNPTLHRIFAVDLVRMFLSLITALSYMGETRVTQTVNIHGWKNAVPAGCFHFESEIKSESMNVTVSTFGAQCTVQTRKRFKQLWFYFFPPFCNCAEVMVVTTNPLKLQYMAFARIFVTTVEIPHTRWTNRDCFY